jgi:modulator of FtsH protease HflK
VTKVMVDSKAGSNLLYLPLDKLMQQAAQMPAGASSTATPPTSGAPAPAAPASTNNGNARSRERESR